VGRIVRLEQGMQAVALEASPSSIGCPLASKMGSSRARVPQNSCIRLSRSSQESFDGHTQATLKGVSPHPTALRPCPSSTRTQARAKQARSTTCAPNFSGIRVWTGRK